MKYDNIDWWEQYFTRTPAGTRDEGDEQGSASADKVLILKRWRETAAEDLHHLGRVGPGGVVEGQVLGAVGPGIILDRRLLCHLHLLEMQSHFLCWGAAQQIGAICARCIPGEQERTTSKHKKSNENYVGVWIGSDNDIDNVEA